MAAITQGAKDIIQNFVNTLSDSPELFDFFIDECKKAKIYSPVKQTYKSRFEYYKSIKRKPKPKSNTEAHNTTLPVISTAAAQINGNLSELIIEPDDIIATKKQDGLPKIEYKSVSNKKKPTKYQRYLDSESSRTGSRMLSTRARNTTVVETNEEVAAAIKYSDKAFKDHFKQMCIKEGVKTFKNIITEETFAYYLIKVMCFIRNMVRLWAQ